MPEITAWIDHQRARGLSEATLRRREVSLRSFQRHIAPRSIVDANEGDVVSWLQTLPSQATRHAYAADLRLWCRWAVRRGMAVDPTADLGAVPDVDRQPRPLDRQRVAMALGAADPDCRVWIMLGVLAGLRRSEIAAMHGRDVDLVAETVAVRGKGQRVRTVPLHPWLVRELSLRSSAGWLWPGQSGGHVHPATVGRRVSAALRAAGLDGAVCHQTRHTAATWLLRSGAPLEVVAQVLGHRRLDTTRGYARVADDAPRRAVGRLRVSTG